MVGGPGAWTAVTAPQILAWRRDGPDLVAGPYRIRYSRQAPLYTALWCGEVLARSDQRQWPLTACERHRAAGVRVLLEGVPPP